ncbi:hypothetical protein U3516DRAFT_750704 [Neocallimastix sp. 'constans']
MEKNIRIEKSTTNRRKKKIIQRYIDALNIELQINVNLIILNDKMEFLEYESLHNHLEKEYEASKSIDMGLICPEFNSIRTQILRSQNKQLPPDITTFEEILEESEYYKTENGDNFMIFKNPNLIISIPISTKTIHTI